VQVQREDTPITWRKYEKIIELKLRGGRSERRVLGLEREKRALLN